MVESGDVATAVLCLLVAYKVALPVLGGIYAHFVRPGKKLRKYGQWAVVTGATDGIGKALCFEFARRGLDVFLISRTESKLAEVEAELSAKYPNRSFKHLSVDYGGGFGAEKRSRVSAALAGLDVGVLANNVGMSYPFTKYYHELSEAECADLVCLNTESTPFAGQDAGDSTSLQRGWSRSNAREERMARFGFAPRDDRSSRNEPHRVENDRDGRFYKVGHASPLSCPGSS